MSEVLGNRIALLDDNRTETIGKIENIERFAG